MNNISAVLLALAVTAVLVAFGFQTYKVTVINTKVQAWDAAAACLAQADSNVKTNRARKAKSEVEATHSLYCIQRAKGIVQ